MVLEKGQMVHVDVDSCLDTDVQDWFRDNNIESGIVVVESFDDSYAWVGGCPYAIQLDYIEEITH